MTVSGREHQVMRVPSKHQIKASWMISGLLHDLLHLKASSMPENPMRGKHRGKYARSTNLVVDSSEDDDISKLYF